MNQKFQTTNQVEFKYITPRQCGQVEDDLYYCAGNSSLNYKQRKKGKIPKLQCSKPDSKYCKAAMLGSDIETDIFYFVEYSKGKEIRIRTPDQQEQEIIDLKQKSEELELQINEIEEQNEKEQEDLENQLVEKNQIIDLLNNEVKLLKQSQQNNDQKLQIDNSNSNEKFYKQFQGQYMISVEFDHITRQLANLILFDDFQQKIENFFQDKIQQTKLFHQQTSEQLCKIIQEQIKMELIKADVNIQKKKQFQDQLDECSIPQQYQQEILNAFQKSIEEIDTKIMKLKEIIDTISKYMENIELTNIIGTAAQSDLFVQK